MKTFDHSAADRALSRIIVAEQNNTFVTLADVKASGIELAAFKDCGNNELKVGDSDSRLFYMKGTPEVLKYLKSLDLVY